MTRDEALSLIASGASYDRLKAARYFAKNATAEDAPTLQLARQRELVSYVKSTLETALARVAEESALPSRDHDGESDLLARIARREATEWVTGLLLHEIASPIGRIALAASREIPNYEASVTRSRIERLRQIFGAIESLKGAAAVPRPVEFSLADLLNKVATDEFPDSGNMISLVGPRPMLIVSDQYLIEIAVLNGLRNAVEAVRSVGGERPHSVVVTWGQTDIDYWVAITDSGPGVPGSVESKFKIGSSGKTGHLGFGLAIARQAVESLGGIVTLLSPATGGAVYEMRWER